MLDTELGRRRAQDPGEIRCPIETRKENLGRLEWTDRNSERRLCQDTIVKGKAQTWQAELTEITAQKGDTVSVHYLGKFPGGKVFDTSTKAEAVKSGLFSPARDYKPLQVVLGAHQVISGFEDALIGMSVNETKEVTLPPEKAYSRTGRHPIAGKTLQFKLLVTNIKKP